ncbi:sulfotransferase family protein [Nocardia tenerifensis]|uniref:Sulfotransferase family protein n=1 Tax=Nocardia tenerifensis TaxID=228006 RepID=A0A318JU94_9NOCA|nr:sulfotransferase [Nocardia tenerifensis]PXX54917.1 sulfotransferase family protein [Nocardia tenerifensis]
MVTVLYITGMMRCGSTFLGNVLNELPRTTHLGERYFLYKNALSGGGTNNLCGCGEPLVDCAMWKSLLHRRGGDAEAVWRYQQAHHRTRHTLARTLDPRPANIATDAAAEVYDHIAEVGGSRLIVDSSKAPGEVPDLARRADVDLRVLHLVRDPRAAVASYSNVKSYLEPMPWWRTVGYWTAFNSASELLRVSVPRDRFLQFKYEWFVAHPHRALRTVLDFVGMSDQWPVVQELVSTDNTVRLHGNHTVTGNPDRLRTGEVAITDTRGWRSMNRLTRVATAISAQPAMSRYGYWETV